MSYHDTELTRRSFLKALGASVALAGLDGCTRMPAEKILPFTEMPEFAPGTAAHYATSMVLDGYATGLIVETHDGRPTKIEGNPDHPASLGAAGILEQASLLQLYDPDRTKRVRFGADSSSWQAFATAMSPSALRQRVGTRGEKLALLIEPTSSGLVESLLADLRSTYPDMSVYYYAPLVFDASSDAFTSGGIIPQLDLRAADVILSVGSDFLAAGPFSLRYARDFADRRRTPLSGMNRLYVAESRFTVTGANADNRLRCRPSEIEPLLTSLLAAVHSGSTPASSWMAAVADDLREHTGRGVVIAGAEVGPRGQALVVAINDVLGNTGRTIWYTGSPLLGAGDAGATMALLVERMKGGGVDTLVCVGGNPSYATPASLDFSSLLKRVPNSAYVGLYENETARDSRWFVPAAHYLESWGDARAYDGTYSIVQPLVQPLYGGKSIVDVLSALGGSPAIDARGLLQASCKRSGITADDSAWAAAVRRGFVAGAPLPRVPAIPRPELLASTSGRATANGSIEIVFARDASVHDGSFANNGWLQELPDPVTKLTWDNAAHVSPATAQRIGVVTGDVVQLRHDRATLQLPTLVVPGHADDVATLHFGYGRTGAEGVAKDVGANVYRLWPAIGAFAVSGASIERSPGLHHALAITQTHWTMEGRDQARSETVDVYRARQRSVETPARRELPIYDPPERLQASHQWAMTIDLATCIGCSACVVACQSENNTPVVGRDDVANSREMHWLRIDRYIEGSPDDPHVVTQPMLCQHCENAPCEYVCPVEATEHSSDGLNEMIYNRCVGTRFCSNNCPYKVRRFNWFDYNARASETEMMAKNPDVTVRERGVMEKCTFCVQRIREAEINAQLSGRPLRGDEVKTACQQACPTNAIVFGSLSERDSEMMRRRAEPRVYGVLAELGTEPRVRYLARIRNPNPRLETSR
jgi:molybdopterin-containing oxidoreductase family iron-sulfur binding subunit